MAREKTLPATVRLKHSLSERIAALRVELCGDRGGVEFARRLGPQRHTWHKYEQGITVPGEVILRVIELTSVEPMWLLHGPGPKYRTGVPVCPALAWPRFRRRWSLSFEPR